jgi:methylmalonyl-CoA/ethylmalonyl-CoA epimerase
MKFTKELNIFGEGAYLDHVGVAVRSIDEVVDAEVKRWHEPTQKVSVAFIIINGVQLELIEPASEDSPIMEYLNKKQSIYHICYRVDDIEEAMRLGREHGFHSFTKPMPAVAYEGKPYVWLLHSRLGLVELIEK